MRVEELNKSLKVAVYSRKSRDESDGEEDVLLSHRMRLNDFIEKHGFTNVDWYEEILSGSSIKGRPKFQEMIAKVEKFIYSAVIVVDFDRLSRGDTLERGIIERAFKETKTLIVMTSGEILDYNNTSEALTAGVKGLLANFELTQSSLRMKEGKKMVVKKGKPHSGVVPFGYKWDRNIREAVVDEEDYKIYRMLIKWYIEDELSFKQIANKLNEMKVTPPRANYWHANSIRRIVLNEFHLGFVTHGKVKSILTDKVNSKGVIIRHNIENPNPSEVLVERGIHKPIKTPEEHALITNRNLIEKGRYANKSVENGGLNFRLKGLVRCHHCGLVMAVIKNGVGEIPYIKKCDRPSKRRTEQCSKNRGVNEEVVFKEVMAQLLKYQETLFTPLNEENDTVVLSIEDEIEILNKSIQQIRKSIEKKKQMFEADIITIDELKSEVSAKENEILSTEDKVEKLTQSAEYVKKYREDNVKKVWTSSEISKLIADPSKFTPNEINLGLKKIISHISYKRNDDDVSIEIIYR